MLTLLNVIDLLCQASSSVAVTVSFTSELTKVTASLDLKVKQNPTLAHPIMHHLGHILVDEYVRCAQISARCTLFDSPPISQADRS